MVGAGSGCLAFMVPVFVDINNDNGNDTVLM